MFQLLYETKSHVVKSVTCGIDPGRENVGVALVLPHKNDQPETILRVHLETKNKEVKRHMTERSLHRAERRRYSREKRKRRAIKCNTTLEAPLTRKYPGYDKG